MPVNRPFDPPSQSPLVLLVPGSENEADYMSAWERERRDARRLPLGPALAVVVDLRKPRAPQNPCLSPWRGPLRRNARFGRNPDRIRLAKWL